MNSEAEQGDDGPEQQQSQQHEHPHHHPHHHHHHHLKQKQKRHKGDDVEEEEDTAWEKGESSAGLIASTSSSNLIPPLSTSGSNLSSSDVAKIAALTRYLSLPAIRDSAAGGGGGSTIISGSSGEAGGAGSILVERSSGSKSPRGSYIGPHPLALAFANALNSSNESMPTESTMMEARRATSTTKLGSTIRHGSRIIGGGARPPQRRSPSTTSLLIGEESPMEEMTKEELMEEILSLQAILEEKEQDVLLAAQIGNDLLLANERLTEQIDTLSLQVRYPEHNYRRLEGAYLILLLSRKPKRKKRI